MAKKQVGLYRTPRKPGYLGGYDWRATTLGCLSLVVVNFVAAQYVAARFQYQPALGPPFLRMKSGGIYQPFSWIEWGWHYCTSPHERIRRPFFEGELIVFVGSLLCVGIFLLLAGHRARKLTENAEGWRPEGGRRQSYLRHNGPEHVLAFAPTRSGKDVGLVIPSLLAWEESAVIFDIKGENWAKNRRVPESTGPGVLQVLNRGCRSASDRYRRGSFQEPVGNRRSGALALSESEKASRVSD